jgi:hypothetical protein
MENQGYFKASFRRRLLLRHVMLIMAATFNENMDRYFYIILNGSYHLGIELIVLESLLHSLKCSKVPSLFLLEIMVIHDLSLQLRESTLSSASLFPS